MTDSFPRQQARTQRFTLGVPRNLTVSSDGTRVAFLRSGGPEDSVTALWVPGRRELAVTGLRGIASAGGQIVGASSLGKLKTVAQNIAVGALLFNYETIGLDAHVVGMVFLFAATALTIASGYRYFADYFRGLARAGR